MAMSDWYCHVQRVVIMEPHNARQPWSHIMIVLSHHVRTLLCNVQHPRVYSSIAPRPLHGASCLNLINSVQSPHSHRDHMDSAERDTYYLLYCWTSQAAGHSASHSAMAYYHG